MKVDYVAEDIVVPLNTQLETGCYELTYDGMAKGYLDFTDTETGDKTITVNICNVCGANFVTSGIEVEQNDPEQPPHYSLVVEKPATKPGGFPEVLDPEQTISLASQKCLDIKVTYAGSLNGMNGQLLVHYKNPDPDTLIIPTFGGKPKSCFEYAPGDATSPTILQWVSSKNAAKILQFAVYNCGNAALTITGIKIEDDFYPDKASEYWTLKDAPTGNVDIGVGEMKVWNLEMLVEDNEIKVGGSMWITYVDAAGAEVTFGAVDLQGLIGPGGTQPIAAASVLTETPELGKPVELSGYDSQPGSEGLADQGYLFMLLEKPAGSQVILNGGPSLPIRKFVPDKAGKYSFGLRVHGESGFFLYSDPATVDVTVP